MYRCGILTWRCRLSFSLLRSAIMCLHGSWSSRHHPEHHPTDGGSIDLACSMGRVPNQDWTAHYFHFWNNWKHAFFCPHLSHVSCFLLSLLSQKKKTLLNFQKKWNAINFKRENRSASRDINFYRAFFQGLNRQESQIKLYTVKKGMEKGFPGLFWT